MEDDNAMQMRVYPNPSNGQFTLLINNKEGDGEYPVSVYNTMGQQVYSIIIKGAEDMIVEKIDLSNMQKGIYFLQAHNKTTGKQMLMKIQVQ